VSKGAIIQACKRGNKAGGYHWHYEGEEQKIATPMNKPIVCIENGKIYESMEEARREGYVVFKSNILNNIAVKGLHFKYLFEKDITN
jgi:hypothetical protein